MQKNKQNTKTYQIWSLFSSLGVGFFSLQFELHVHAEKKKKEIKQTQRNISDFKDKAS